MHFWSRARLVAAVFTACCSLSLAQTVVEPVTAPVASGSHPAPAISSQAPKADESREQLRIGPGDLVEVTIFGVADFKQEGRISDSGEMSLPLIGTVHIGGSTIEDAGAIIKDKLVSGGYFRDPAVTVLIKDFASQGISVMGEVEKPGVYPAMSTRRLYDMVSLAGGFTNKAGKLVTITHRDKPTQPDSVVLTNDPAKSMQSNVVVYPGDTIVVSKAGIVYVVGDVGRPGGFVMENGEKMTVLQAIAMAQGVNRTAALSQAKLVRRNTGQPEEVKIALKGILSAKSPDVDLMPEDILFIPGSIAKNVMKRGFESAIQIATNVAIYGVH